MGQVQNGHLYIMYRRSSQKNEAEERKKLTEYISLLLIAKSTLKTPLTFIKVDKTKHENFDLVYLLSSSFFFCFFSVKHNSKTIWFVKILNIPNGWYFTVDYSYWLSSSCDLRLASYGLETVTNMLRVLLRTLLLSFYLNNFVGVARMARPHLDYRTLALQATMSLLGTNCV